MRLRTRISALFLLVFTLITMLPISAVIAFAESVGNGAGNTLKEDADILVLSLIKNLLAA